MDDSPGVEWAWPERQQLNRPERWNDTLPPGPQGFKELGSRRLDVPNQVLAGDVAAMYRTHPADIVDPDPATRSAHAS